MCSISKHMDIYLKERLKKQKKDGKLISQYQAQVIKKKKTLTRKVEKWNLTVMLNDSDLISVANKIKEEM